MGAVGCGGGGGAPAASRGRANTGHVRTVTPFVGPVISRMAPVMSRTAPVTPRAAPVTSPAAPVTSRVAWVISRAGPVMSQFAPVMSRGAPVMSRAAPVISRLAPVMSRAAPVMSQFAPVTSQVMAIGPARRGAGWASRGVRCGGVSGSVPGGGGDGCHTVGERHAAGRETRGQTFTGPPARATPTARGSQRGARRMGLAPPCRPGGFVARRKGFHLVAAGDGRSFVAVDGEAANVLVHARSRKSDERVQAHAGGAPDERIDQEP